MVGGGKRVTFHSTDTAIAFDEHKVCGGEDRAVHSFAVTAGFMEDFWV